MPSVTFFKPTCSCDHAHYFEVPVVINVFVSLGEAGVLATTKVYFDKMLKSKSKLWLHLVLYYCKLVLAQGLLPKWRIFFKSRGQNFKKYCNVYRVPSNMRSTHNIGNCSTYFFQ